jgi:CBS domain-containing protein
MAAVDAAEVLIKNGISGAPVIDSERQLLGLVSEFDCLRAVAASDYEMDSHDAIELVGDLMTREALTVPPEMDLFTLAHEFVTRRVRRFPVVENGEVIGQVSRRDALKAALVLRKERITNPPNYPDYPRGRAPIRNYPKG